MNFIPSLIIIFLPLQFKQKEQYLHSFHFIIHKHSLRVNVIVFRKFSIPLINFFMISQIIYFKRLCDWKPFLEHINIPTCILSLPLFSFYHLFIQKALKIKSLSKIIKLFISHFSSQLNTEPQLSSNHETIYHVWFSNHKQYIIYVIGFIAWVETIISMSWFSISNYISS